MENLSTHVTYEEATSSPNADKLGIDNTPNEAQLKRMKALALNVFEKVREHFKVPIHISSMFRSKELNKELKGAEDSQHMANNGAAMDIDADYYGSITNLSVFNYIKDNLEYDQLIAESVHKGSIQWVHVSYKEGANRKQALIMYKTPEGKTVYSPYTLEKLNKFIKTK